MRSVLAYSTRPGLRRSRDPGDACASGRNTMAGVLSIRLLIPIAASMASTAAVEHSDYRQLSVSTRFQPADSEGLTDAIAVDLQIVPAHGPLRLHAVEDLEAVGPNAPAKLQVV
jgi:hypothetical protein